ncbi:MAG: tRNA pseudouridine(55) synthase TruB [Desulfuromonadales bacterium]|nr:tRNA pseudouridine(55) synthase TruB [Desulfuromonadales bacterium]
MNNGFFVIDKPAGITSHDVVSRVRRILGTRKVGHTGTLDPFATGVLPVAVNDGTKVIPFLDEGVKQYDALLRLGVVTDTLDMTGSVVGQSDCSSIGKDRLEAVLACFTGTISQIPPMFSAIKQGGQPLYKLARQGVEVERQPRQIQIFSLELLQFESPLVRLRVTCSRGTYIRSLAYDIGSELGCGAALQELRRIASGSFHLSTAISLESLAEYAAQTTLETVCVTPFNALGHLPEIPLTEAGHEKVMNGRFPEWHETELPGPAVFEAFQMVRLSRNGTLDAVAQSVPGPDGCGRLILKRVFV